MLVQEGFGRQFCFAKVGALVNARAVKIRRYFYAVELADAKGGLAGEVLDEDRMGHAGLSCFKVGASILFHASLSPYQSIA